MAHSYVEAFPSEIEAFRAFAEDFPDRVVLLVDTYDTAHGVRNAIEVAGELRRRGQRLTGIRLDSGDLARLAIEARRALDEAGLEEVQILASGGLDEHEIARLVSRGAPIDAYGVGTKVGVAEDAPALDSVYKLVEYASEPVCKLSRRKATLPGPKQVWRTPREDVIGLAGEGGPEDGEPLLVEVMKDGRRLDDGSIEAAAARFASDLEALPAELRSLRAPHREAERTSDLEELARAVAQRIRERESL